MKNECCSPLHFYFYVDYEQVDSLPENTLYFHALWNRECPTDGVPSSARSRHMEWIMGGEQDKHLSAEGNYVLLDAEGSGQYVGCNINIHNLENSSEWDWFGEGDDAILIDDEPWPPRLHGTGMEDYLGLAWCPTQEYHALYNGCTLSPMDNYKGMASYYRFHILDPIMFDRHIRVTFEHGHNNNRSDDWSTTAYWYQTEPHNPSTPCFPWSSACRSIRSSMSGPAAANSAKTRKTSDKYLEEDLTVLLDHFLDIVAESGYNMTTINRRCCYEPWHFHPAV